MPFDGKNFTETKPDVFSLEGLIAWLEKQPAETEYCYTEIGNCLLTRYVAAVGGTLHPMQGYVVDGQRIAATMWGDGRASDLLFAVARGAPTTPDESRLMRGLPRGETFKDALNRARALQAR